MVAVVHMSQRGSFVREGSILILARILRVPVAAHLHGSQFPAFYDAHQRLVAAILRFANVILVLTDEVQTILTSMNVASRPRISRVKNAVELPPTVPSKEKIVLFAGEVGDRKGVPILLEAWDRIQSQFEGWRLVIAGPIVDLELPGQHPDAVWAGTLEHSEVLELQSRAAIAVLPSRHEALPLFLLEAMARACAVVATPVGEIDRLVGSDAGIIVPVGDVDKLQKAMIELIANPEQCSHYGAAARQRIAMEFSADIVGPELCREWLKLLEGTQ